MVEPAQDKSFFDQSGIFPKDLSLLKTRNEINIDLARAIIPKSLKVNMNCPICLDDFVDVPKMCSFCRNVFCNKCIGSWINKNLQSKCPLCRKKLSI